ncbi:MAG TPA: hypothetical protein VGK89_15150 [Candidatus Eisenbacteria bacterium]|jgi:hypothetical protein
MKSIIIVGGAAIATLVCSAAWAVRDGQELKLAFPPARRIHEDRIRPARATIIDNAQTIGINNIRMFVTNTGSFAWDKVDAGQPAGFEFPRGTGKTALFAAGLWLGAKINGELHLAVAEYSDEYRPGSAVGGVADDPDALDNKVYKLDRVYNTAAAREAALTDYNAGAVPHGAPPVSYVISGSDTTLSTLGDEMMWAVYNDLDSLAHTNRADNLKRSLGIEVQQTTFAFASQGALGNTVFIKYKFINRGPWFLDEMYASQWSDPDLGGATDDLVGCDVARSLGFVYNATNNDAQYGSTVPAVGFDFFKGPIVGGSPLVLASFNKYINATDPNTAVKTYNYMQGLYADGATVIDPTTGSPTKFQVSGNPATGTGWLDSNPADRRFMLSTGPFTMAPGDSQEIVVGIVVGQSVNRIASVALMKFLDETAQSAFDLNFNVPPPPDPPAVTVTPADGAVLLTWDNHAERYNATGYAFEGYALYQQKGVGSDFKRIATFDLNDGITTVLDNDFDTESFVALPKVAAQGNDGGIRYQYRITSDGWRGGPLYNGTTYYFTVRSYSVGLGLVPQVKESADTVRKVVPQTPPGGVDLSSAGLASGPTYGRYNTGLPPSTDNVQVLVKDRDQMIDASYKVGYKPDATGIPVWYVTRTTAAGTDTVVNEQGNFSGDEQYPIFNGVQVKVLGAPYKQLLSVTYLDTGGNPPGFVGYGGDLGLGFFDGSADYAINIPLGGFTSMLDPANIDAFHNVEIRFTGGPPGQKAYRYMGSTSTSPTRTYAFQDFVDVPFTVWDIDNNRQLNAGFNEMEYASPNGVWDPDTLADPFDRREFVVVMASDYSATALPYYTTQHPDLKLDGANLDLMYVFWPHQAANGPAGPPIPVDDGDKVLFQLASRSPNDYFTFSARAANRSNVTLEKQELDRVKAVPNPYYAHSTYELDQFNRVVKFTHLPQQCTIRLFNLAGDLVRTIQKNDATSQAIWNLETDVGLPVGSGIYVYHVDAPGVGNKVGKLAVFIEKERLNNY